MSDLEAARKATDAVMDRYPHYGESALWGAVRVVVSEVRALSARVLGGEAPSKWAPKVGDVVTHSCEDSPCLVTGRTSDGRPRVRTLRHLESENEWSAHDALLTYLRPATAEERVKAGIDKGAPAPVVGARPTRHEVIDGDAMSPRWGVWAVKSPGQPSRPCIARCYYEDDAKMVARLLDAAAAPKREEPATATAGDQVEEIAKEIRCKFRIEPGIPFDYVTPSTRESCMEAARYVSVLLDTARREEFRRGAEAAREKIGREFPIHLRGWVFMQDAIRAVPLPEWTAGK